MIVFRDVIIAVVISVLLQCIKEEVPIDSNKKLISIVAQIIVCLCMILEFAIGLLVIWAIIATVNNGGDYESVLPWVWEKIKFN